VHPNQRNIIVTVYPTALILVFALCGCSTSEPFRGVHIGEHVSLITSVPPLLQDKEFSCGPTCVFAVATYWEVDPGILLSNSPMRFGADMNAEELCRIAGLLALQAFSYSGSLADLEKQVNQGRPLLVLLPKPRYDEGYVFCVNHVPLTTVVDLVSPRAAHWALVIGFSRDMIILQDPAHGRMAVPRLRFHRWWSAKQYTCVLIAPQ
jgi:hypothetical protein